ncbi:MAG: type II toxin-antitoxin system PemK/MazF family toxin [Ahrensia sp.]|nr:type II toxin-antitoxin system PemK/MazF family toxin [Ahrensia sp.]
MLLCNFGNGFVEPEMTKRRPVIVLSPRIQARPYLCTVVALSTTPPQKEMPYHCRVELPFSMPKPFNAQECWIKGDMVNAVGFHRLDLIRLGKDAQGNRRYLKQPVGDEILRQTRQCVLHGLGLSTLTKFNF